MIPGNLSYLEQYDRLIKPRGHSMPGPGSTGHDEVVDARRQSFMKSPDEWRTHNFVSWLSQYLHHHSALLAKYRREDIAKQSPNAIELAARALRPEPTAEDIEARERVLFVKREKEFQQLSRRWIVNVAADCPAYLRHAEERVKFDCMQRVEVERSRRDAAMESGILGRYLERKSQKIVQVKRNNHSEQ